MDKSKLRDAATLIILRDRNTAPRVLMGQRGAGAAFMPNKFVFPGGAVDPADENLPVRPVTEPCRSRLMEDSIRAPEVLAAAAIRELWEETGLTLGRVDAWPDPPQGWRGFAANGLVPNTAALRFVFRAVTPKGRPRRFDARFFLSDAADLTSDPDDFSRAEDELAHLQWVPLDRARHFDLPFITQVVLAELMTQLKSTDAPTRVPYFRNNDESHLVSQLKGRSPIQVLGDENEHHDAQRQ